MLASSPGQLLLRGGDLRLLGLGDSLTHGWMVRRSFFELACDELERQISTLRIQRINAGVPGDTAFGGLGRLPDLLRSAPGLVCLQFGVNDCFAGERVDVYRRHMGRLVDAVRAAGALPVLVVSCPLPNEAAMRWIQSYYATLRELGRERAVAVADLAGHWQAGARQDSPDPALWLADGVHPSDSGHGLMAEGLVSALLPAPGSSGGLTSGP